MKDWFSRWFGKEYLELYPHRNEAEAQTAVEMIRKTVGAVPSPPRILDLACGTGRHTRALRKWAWAVGLDLSAALLQEAHTDDPSAPYVRGDMRMLPFADESFGVVVNLFTSFGYFDTDEQHAGVMREVARVTSRGGTFVLDFFNAAQVRRTLVPFDERNVNGRNVRQYREISADGRFVVKHIDADECPERYTERVRLFSPEELRRMLEESRFAVRRQDGNYDGSSWTEDSPRVIMFAERL
jgi:ubiquinone/menaquinone biosynthesis C-methylase UbiE